LLVATIEDGSLYSKYQANNDNYMPNGHLGWRGMRNVLIKTYLCPSEQGAET